MAVPMAGPHPDNLHPHYRRWFAVDPIDHSRPVEALRWAMANPWRSRRGASIVRDLAARPAPKRWDGDFPDRRVLVVGTGPSLDRVDDAWLDRFDTRLWLNHAINRSPGGACDYFFTMDLGALGLLLADRGEDRIAALGAERAIAAPYQLDLPTYLTPHALSALSFVAPDACRWDVQRARLPGLGIRVPAIVRYTPRQPDWSHWRLPPRGRTIPIPRATSALAAVLFAAMRGAREIGLIGCDFGGGRAVSSANARPVPEGDFFVQCRTAFAAISAALDRQSVRVLNHSWVDDRAARDARLHGGDASL